MTDADRLQDWEAARRILLADGEFRPAASLAEMARSLLIQRDHARRNTKHWRDQVMAVAEADIAQSAGRG